MLQITLAIYCYKIFLFYFSPAERVAFVSFQARWLGDVFEIRILCYLALLNSAVGLQYLLSKDMYQSDGGIQTSSTYVYYCFGAYSVNYFGLKH